MNDRIFPFLFSSYVAFAPLVAIASIPSTPKLSLSYVQSVSISGLNYAKLAFSSLATTTDGVLASAGSYVSYMRPTATFVARAILPRLLLAASGVGTAALVGLTVYELWKYLESKGYKYDPLSNALMVGGSIVAGIDQATTLGQEFLNSTNQFFEGYFRIRSDSSSTYISGNSAQTVCSNYLKTVQQDVVSGCSFTGSVSTGVGNVPCYSFSYKYKTSTGTYTGGNCVSAFTDIVTKAPESTKPRVLESSVVAQQISDSISQVNSEIPNNNDQVSVPSSLSLGLIKELFNPAYSDTKQNIEDAKSNARPAYEGEVSPPSTIPSDAITNTDAPSITLPNPGIKNPDGTISELPSFCSWAQPVCNLADFFTTTVNPENTSVPYIEHEVTIKNRLSSNFQCPPPKALNVLGMSFSIEYDMLCNFGEIVRPFVISAGYIFSAFIVLRRF